MMKGIVKGLVAAGFGLAIVATPALAQKPGPEFGVQFAGFSMMNPDGDDNNTTAIGLGNGDLTVAFYINEMIAIEPGLTFTRLKFEGVDDAVSAMGLQVAVPIYLNKGWGKEGGLFVAPHVGMDRVSAGGESGSQMHFGASVGTKIRVTDNVFWRVQGGFDMGQEGGDVTDPIYFPKYTSFGASFGFTAFWP